MEGKLTKEVKQTNEEEVEDETDDEDYNPSNDADQSGGNVLIFAYLIISKCFLILLLLFRFG